MMPILITGSNGLVGSSLAKELRRQNFPIVTTSRKIGSDPDLCDYEADLCSGSQIDRVLSSQKMGTVIHAAGRIIANDLETYLQDNFYATQNILLSSRNSGVKKFIYLSTIEVYENDGPYSEESQTQALSDYAKTKLATEDLVLAASSPDFQTIVIRLAGVHGPERKSGVIYNFIKAAKKNEPIQILDPLSIFRLSFTADISLGIKLILKTENFTQAIYNMAGKEAVSLLDFARMAKRVTNSRSELICSEKVIGRNRDLRIDKISQDFGYFPLPTEIHLKSIASAI